MKREEMRVLVAFRIERGVLARLDRYTAELSAQVDVPVTRSAVVRKLLLEGLQRAGRMGR